MISKLIFIPRALFDILKVLLHSNISLRERFDISKALLKIKIASTTKKINDSYSFFLGNRIIHCYYNKDIGFLIKEIFCDEVYSVKTKTEIKTILDLGANVGMSITYFKMRFPNVTIDAFEPDKNSFKMLQKNVNENNFESISLFEMAVSNQNGFLFAENSELKASLNSRFLKEGLEQNEKIISKDIESLLDRNFDVIKMDIEGGEWDLFKKITDKNMIAKANHWFVEFHEIEKNKKQFEEILNYFAQSGFKMENRKDVVYFYKKEE